MKKIIKRKITEVNFDGKAYVDGFNYWEGYGKKRVYLNCLGEKIFIDLSSGKWVLNGVEGQKNEEEMFIFEAALDGKDVTVKTVITSESEKSESAHKDESVCEKQMKMNFEVEEDEFEITVKLGKDFTVIDIENDGYEFVITQRERMLFTAEEIHEIERKGVKVYYVRFQDKEEALERAKKYMMEKGRLR